ncbi:homeobox domain protein, partial [Cooperia oncophora]
LVSESPNSALKRRFRTNFTEAQSLLLEEAFQESHYPDQSAKKDMAEKLDIPEDRITKSLDASNFMWILCWYFCYFVMPIAHGIQLMSGRKLRMVTVGHVLRDTVYWPDVRDGDRD